MEVFRLDLLRLRTFSSLDDLPLSVGRLSPGASLGLDLLLERLLGECLRPDLLLEPLFGDSLGLDLLLRLL